MEPVDFEIYPKMRVELLYDIDTSHHDTLRHKPFHMHGGLIDSPRLRGHPVTDISIGKHVSHELGSINKFPATVGAYSELGVVLSSRASIHRCLFTLFTC